MKPRKKFGQCPKCKELTHRTTHHILPKRFFGGRGPIEFICRSCHDNLELLIPQNEQMPEEFYRLIYDAFINKET